MSGSDKRLFRGIAAALPTPFLAGGGIDEEAYAGLIRRQIDGGAAAIVAAGTTGEGAALEPPEHQALVALTVRITAGRVPVIAGVGAGCTARSEGLAAGAAEAGADGILAVTPYYNKATPAGLIAHYTAVERAAGIPVLLYNVPSRTGVDLPLEVCRELSQHEGIAGIKEASGHPLKTARILQACGADLPVYSGSDEVILPILALGGEGAVSVVTNLVPERTARLAAQFFAGDVAGAARSQLSLLPLIDALFCEVNPIPVKAASEMLGLLQGVWRLPLCPPSPAAQERIRRALAAEGLLPGEKE